MRLLVLDYEYPWPPMKGYTIPSFHLVWYLAERHDVHLVTFEARQSPERPDDPLRGLLWRHTRLPAPHLDVLTRAWSILRGDSFYAKRYGRHLGEVLAIIDRDRIDAVLARGAPIAGMFLGLRGVPVVSGILEFGSRVLLWHARRKRNPAARFLREVEARKLAKVEERICFEMPFVFVGPCQKDIAEEMGATGLWYVPLGVETERFEPGGVEPERNLIGYLGVLREGLLNEQAAWILARQIMPGVWRAVPEARLLLLGNSPSRRLEAAAAAEPRIELPGFVENLPAAMARAELFAFPIPYATGTKNSVLMALSMGKAVVGTPYALRGVDKELAAVVEAGTAQEFIGETVRLLKSPARSAEMGRINRKYAERYHSWASFCEPVERMLIECSQTFKRERRGRPVSVAAPDLAM